jgi:hypothetical protein
VSGKTDKTSSAKLKLGDYFPPNCNTGKALRHAMARAACVTICGQQQVDDGRAIAFVLRTCGAEAARNYRVRLDNQRKGQDDTAATV